MADIIFPPSLPTAMIAGYSDKRGPITNRIERDLGTDRVRRMFRNIYAIEQVQWDMAECQFEIFEDFFYETLNGGTRRFDCQLSDYKDGLAWSTALFQGVYKAQVISPGDRWLVQGTLLLFGKPSPVRVVANVRGTAYNINSAALTLQQPKRVYLGAGLPTLAGMRLTSPDPAYMAASSHNEAGAKLQDTAYLYLGRSQSNRAGLAIGQEVKYLYGDMSVTSSAAATFVEPEPELYGYVSTSNRAGVEFEVQGIFADAQNSNLAGMEFDIVGGVNPGTVDANQSISTTADGGTVNANEPI